MNIVISHVYSNDNKGDAALLSVLLRDVKTTFKDPHITILTLDTIGKNELFEGILMKNSFNYYVRDLYKNIFVKVVYGIFVTCVSVLWALTYRITHKSLPVPKHLHDLMMSYAKADLIIPVGGGYIRGKEGMMNTIILFYILHSLFIGYLLGKVQVGYAQSVGPFGNAIQRLMARFTLKKLTGIIARETITLSLFKKWGMDKKTILSVDSGFLFESSLTKNLREDLHYSDDQMVVGITSRTWLKPSDQKDYEKSMAAFADFVIEKYNAVVVFIPQVTVENHNDDDRQSSMRIYDFIVRKDKVHVVQDRLSHYEIKAYYANLDYLIGMRFHSVIFALTSIVPSIAIEYEYKTRGIMTDLGLSDWVVSIDDVRSKKLPEIFDTLILKKSEYKERLEAILPTYKERAAQSIIFVKNIFEEEQVKQRMKKSPIQKKRKKRVLSILLLSFIAVATFVTFIRFKNYTEIVYKKPIPEVGHAIGISAEGGLSKHDLAYINERLDQMTDLGVTWIRFDIEWSHIQARSKEEYNWTNYDVLLQAIKAHNLKPVGLVIFSPEWARDTSCSGGVKCPPQDPKEFARFMGVMAARYKNDINVWEVWNEPNNAGFWAPGANCKAYTRLLKETYPAIKSANPEAIVLTGGLAPLANSTKNMTRLDFLSCIYENGGKNYFDAVGDHPYTFPKLPSDGINNAWAQMNETVLSMRSIMIAYGDAHKKIWLTEVGTPTNGPDPYWYVSEEKQIEIIKDTLTLYKNYEWAGPLFWYTLRDYGTSKDTIENFFGLRYADNTSKPAYQVLKDIISEEFSK